MILLLDIGNTRVKWAWLEEFGLGTASAAAHDTTHRAWQSEIEADGRRPHRIVVANVAGPAIRDAVADWATGHYGVTPELLSAQATAHGVHSAYAQPATLGVDRWLALIAARSASPRPTCVLNAGTAFVIDTLDGEGRHLGGLILPGLQLLNESLAGYAARTGRAVAAGGAQSSSRAAEGTFESGPGPLVLLAAAADRATAEFAARVGTPPRVVLTGGDAIALAPLLETAVEFVPDLVLEGLARVATAPRA